jgi:hypothetical protein
MALLTIPEDQSVAPTFQEGGTNGTGEKRSYGKMASLATVLSLALFFVATIGTDFLESSNYKGLIALSSQPENLEDSTESDRQLVRRRLQLDTLPVVPAPAPTRPPSLAFPSIQTDFNLTVCGTCARAVLGPFVSVLTDTFTSAGWDAKVSILDRSECSECGSPLENAAADSPNRFLQVAAGTQEMFGFEIVQAPNENATSTTVNTTDSVALNSTSRIDVDACLNNITIVNQILIQGGWNFLF